MFELKSLHPDAIPAALEKAQRYRLLNEPEQAESICEDVLRIDPEQSGRDRDADPRAHRSLRRLTATWRRMRSANSYSGFAANTSANTTPG